MLMQRGCGGNEEQSLRIRSRLMLEDRWGFEGLEEGRKVKSIGIAYTAWRFDWDHGVWESGDRRGQYTG